jgi:hypothetical protein
MRRDCYRALAIPESAYYEINLFWPDKSVLMIDDREGFIVGGGFKIPPDTPLLDYSITAKSEQKVESKRFHRR